MSKLKKVKKQKKGMSPQAKRNLGNVFKSIISNKACIEGAKEAPWWIAVIFLVLSVFLPVIPTWVNASQAYGSSFLAGYNMGSDVGLKETFSQFEQNGYEFNIQNGLLTVSQNGEPWKEDGTQEDKEFHKVYTDGTQGKEIYTFFTVVTYKYGQEFTNLVNEYATKLYASGTLAEWDPAMAELDKTPYTPSFLIIGRVTFGMALYKIETAQRVSASSGGMTYNRVQNGDLIKRIVGENPSTISESEVYTNFRAFCDEAYLEIKDITTRNTVLLYAGIYLALAFILGLMVFLLTRGKNNVFRYLNFFVCQKIAWWSLFTPAVLGMIFAFIMKGNIVGQMAFIILASLRIMWLSMRQLRPVQ